MQHEKTRTIYPQILAEADAWRGAGEESCEVEEKEKFEKEVNRVDKFDKAAREAIESEVEQGGDN